MLKRTLGAGFLDIKWPDCDLRSSTIIKGYDLAKSGHVQNVREIQDPGQRSEIEITGVCVRQTRLNERPYNVVLIINEQREVKQAHCQCPAGTVGNCKHTAALFYFINHEREETKTDKACQWNAPSTMGQSLYPKGKPFDEIFGYDPVTRPTFQRPSQAALDARRQKIVNDGDVNSLMLRVLTAKV
jgi:hypothetical protein